MNTLRKRLINGHIRYITALAVRLPFAWNWNFLGATNFAGHGRLGNPSVSELGKIEWTKSTFNPWIGCTKVSPGCDQCYAEVSTPARAMKIHWGSGQQRHRTALTNWNQVRRWNAKAAKTGEFWPVFCASLADIFDNEVPDEWRADFWALVRECPHLTFQVLTKRIGNVKRMLSADWGDGYPNVWLVISVVNQEEFDRDLPKLIATPARVRGLSMEPLLGPVDMRGSCRPWGPDGASAAMLSGSTG